MTPKHLSKFIGQRVHVLWADPNDDWHYFIVLAVDGGEVWMRGIDDPVRGFKHDGSSFIEQCRNVRRIRAAQAPEASR